MLNSGQYPAEHQFIDEKNLAAHETRRSIGPGGAGDGFTAYLSMCRRDFDNWWSIGFEQKECLMNDREMVSVNDRSRRAKRVMLARGDTRRDGISAAVGAGERKTFAAWRTAR